MLDLDEMPTEGDQTPPTPSAGAVWSAEALAQLERLSVGASAIVQLDRLVTETARLRTFLDLRLGEQRGQAPAETVDRALQLILGYETRLRDQAARLLPRSVGVFTVPHQNGSTVRRCSGCSRDLWPSEAVCSACNPPKSAAQAEAEEERLALAGSHATSAAVMNTRRGPHQAEW